jgi:hypothetical protein
MPHRDILPRPPRLRVPPRLERFEGASRRASRLATLALVAMLARRRKGKDPDQGGVPVEPNRPNTLTGGAAAPLEFEGE